MIQDRVKILVNDKIAPEYYKMILKTPQIAKIAEAGQFVHIKVSDTYDPLLRRPFSIHSIKNEENIEILYRVVGKGTALLSQKKIGEELDILGPLGNGFKIDGEKEKIIIIGGGAGIAPLFFLTQKAILKSNNIIVLIGAQTKNQILCEQEFKNLGVEVHIATEDGSYGHKGMITDLLNLLSPFPINTSLFACGPYVMLKKIAMFSISHNLPCQVSLESKIACGVGACLGCVIKVKSETKTTYKRACKEGPVFEANEIIWE